MGTAGIHHVGLAVADLDTTTRFFTDGLGWKLVREVPEALKPRKIAIADANGNTDNVQVLEQPQQQAA